MGGVKKRKLKTICHRLGTSKSPVKRHKRLWFLLISITILSSLALFSRYLLLTNSRTSAGLLVQLQYPSIIPLNRRASAMDYTSDCLTGDILYEWSVDRSSWEKLDQSALTSKYTRFTARESNKHRERSFAAVFESGTWLYGSVDVDEPVLQVSGPGSLLGNAQEALAILHVAINAVKFNTGKDKIRILDIPCGDLQWMEKLLLSRDDIFYTGIDIVKDVIKHHKKFYSHLEHARFIHGDVLSRKISVSGYDIIICRMMLQHLYNKDAMKILHKFSQSSSTYLFTTTFPKVEENVELEDDNNIRFRPLNLEIPPFSLSPPVCIHHDSGFEDQQHLLGLWKLPLYRVSNCSITSRVIKRTSNLDKYSCV